MRGSRELDTGRAVGQLIAHEFWNRQMADGVVQRILQARGKACAGSGALGEEIILLSVGFNGQIRNGQVRQTFARQFLDQGRRSEEHTSELQSLMRISYAVFCLKKKKKKQNRNRIPN